MTQLPPLNNKIKRRSPLEREMEWLLTINGITGWKTEVQFAPSRKYRADFCWPSEKIILEIEGGIWGNAKRGRHVRAQGYESDVHKYNLAICLGFLVLRATANMIHKNPQSIIEQLQTCLERRKAN